MLKPVLIGAGNPLFEGIKQTQARTPRNQAVSIGHRRALLPKSVTRVQGSTGPGSFNKIHDQIKGDASNGNKTPARASSTSIAAFRTAPRSPAAPGARLVLQEL